ncbi:xanthine dehydrogenase family protein molybdopterin-binding subunit [Microvirga sp. 3-52]|uniref:xanthine dehydrogenase family protein molybdopterin-binding subunit n=1 Tax=Microvirga sp. 3-52 TaxID=2792425 RepID=UPI001AD59C0F|nr:xanthine dehydrogenase family protein molybdopterin-binding subunit [Microvirga sp. 3-52]MBO1906815.1 xanthine dehydrogenase family protein molybdopterin-binding subunit [Microvirga sp. 3-52]MBS7453986.1 xanthine dehydrogenase family protein molybdopterin-binding subunit [Microvirga sp. 3-52]
MQPANAYIGTPQNRVDGRAKVTGEAKYAAEFDAPDLAYGIVVSSAIAKGRIKSIDTSAALAVPGVLQVFTHENRSRTAWFDRNFRDETAPPGSPFRPLYDEGIVYGGQPVALVVAEEFELAAHAASLVRIEYETDAHMTDLDLRRSEAYVPPKKRSNVKPPPSPRGDAEGALAQAPVKVHAEYRVAIEHHNPMETHASTVIYEQDGTLTIHDKTQGAQNSQSYVSSVFGLSSSQVRVASPYIGGAFGSGPRPQYQLFLAVMAALELKRSVRVVLTRDQMFTFGYRPLTIQTISLGANPDGKLVSLMHDAIQTTSTFEDYQEVVVNWSNLLYHCDNVKLTYQLAQVDTYTPIDMRAPGAALGVTAIETAMDELAYAAGIDPVELRLRNYAETDEADKKTFTSKELRACYQLGAERFGWAKRNPEPRSMRDGRELVGWGMATGVWEAIMQKTAARAVLTRDGNLEITSATTDIGTGTYTILTQIAAETLGLPMEAVTTKIGDSSLPKSPVQGGSWTAASAGSAVQNACLSVREQLFKYARQMEESPLANASIEQVMFVDGRICLMNEPNVGVIFAEAMQAAGVERVEAEEKASPGMLTSMRHSGYSHSAVFVDVKVDEELGRVRVTRVVNAVAAGTILNPKTARSQILGGVVFGIGMALEEESMLDHNLGRFMNHNLAEYHVPVNADVYDIDVIFVSEHEQLLNPLGIKGLGEIGVVGTAAAIGNAVFHATGKRVREYPITVDKLLG